MNAKQLQEIASANWSEWKRTVGENQALQLDLCALRKRYRLPVKHEDFDSWYNINWFDESQHQRQEQFHKDVKKLAEKHQVNMQKWGSPFIYLIVLGEPGPIFIERGYPSITVSIDEKGRIIQNIVPALDTAMSNPIVQRYMANMHKSNVLTLDPPPQPQKKLGSRKTDWRPVLEWSKRHPEFSLKEIAQILGFAYGTVRNRLNNLVSLDTILEES